MDEKSALRALRDEMAKDVAASQRDLLNTLPGADGAQVPYIAPTVGRVVWFWDHASDGDDHPMRADICFVNEDGTVNLSVNDHDGNAFPYRRCELHQGDAEGCSLPRPFATWMPFQRGQASKNDQLRADLMDLRQTALEAAQEALEDERTKLQTDMLREQVRQLRLQNDAQEMANGKVSGAMAAEDHIRRAALHELWAKQAKEAGS